MAVTNVAELNALVERVKKAQREYASFTQEQVDKIFRAAALHVLNLSHDALHVAHVILVHADEKVELFSVRFCHEARTVRHERDALLPKLFARSVVRSVPDLVGMRRGGSAENLMFHPLFSNKKSENALRHGRATDVSVTDK